jgi:hypothetical protein
MDKSLPQSTSRINSHYHTRWRIEFNLLRYGDSFLHALTHRTIFPPGQEPSRLRPCVPRGRHITPSCERSPPHGRARARRISGNGNQGQNPSLPFPFHSQQILKSSISSPGIATRRDTNRHRATSTATATATNPLPHPARGATEGICSPSPRARSPPRHACVPSPDGSARSLARASFLARL